MTPIDQFMHSVQESFAENRSTNWPKLGLVIGAAVALSLGLSRWIRRRKALGELARRIHVVLSGAGLSTFDLDDLTRIARAGQRPVIDVMTVLAAFEHATASLLAEEAPTVHPVPGSWFERVRRLRKALGFSPLSAHLWLLTTRELVVGDSVATGGISGHVAEVTEASFAVDWPAAAVLVVDAPSIVTIDRPDDARYRSRVRLLSLEALPATATEPGGTSAGRRAFFAHDEQPERQQDREYLRLRVKVPVRLQILSNAPTDPALVGTAAPGSTIEGTIADVSAGGLSLNLPASPTGPLVRGVHVLCWFTLDHHAAFEALGAVVMAADMAAGPPPGEQHLRLSFVAIEEGERDRLAAAVARHQGAAPPAPGSAKP